MNKLSSFGIWGNTEKESFWEVLPSILEWSKKKNIEPYITSRIFEHSNWDGQEAKVIKTEKILEKLDFMLVLGGDGTFLSLARVKESCHIPILGIHLGDLGFLAQVTLQGLFHRLDQVAKGDFIIEKRILIKSHIQKDNKIINHLALNDFVISNAESYRMLNATVFINEHFVGNYRADGIVVATPTGSTAYSLSAGGPIVTPQVDAIIITPIAAHTLTSRPLVVSGNDKIMIEFSNNNQPVLFTSDGQIHENLDVNNKVKIAKADYQIKLISFTDNDYFKNLKEKMGWGKRGEDS
ncbi:MAG: NAD(+)/NADH kinase [Fidelibacterota bacterium]|jgi:NAD+ kinase|tara:strand:+ start:3525 stop:4409 length:885 start_codon:yes stop_codon:yes gene_type:complete